MICKLLHLPEAESDLSDWEKIVDNIRNPKGVLTLGIVGKYVQHQDAYKSIMEALQHGANAEGYKLNIRLFEADKVLENNALLSSVQGCDGYLVPGGFGERGWMGKIFTAKYCRENKIPYFGICLGMQVMVVEFARHVLGLKDANSTEIDPDTTNPVISLLSEQRDVKEIGGTMRLGSYPCRLKPNSLARKAYGKEVINERHRHRYEFNGRFQAEMEQKGLMLTGILEGGTLGEIAEVAGHPWMLGVQFHPEFKSKPTDPHPLFRDFIKAMIQKQGTGSKR
jgi:CTP synthase